MIKLFLQIFFKSIRYADWFTYFLYLLCKYVYHNMEFNFDVVCTQQTLLLFEVCDVLFTISFNNIPICICFYVYNQ